MINYHRSVFNCEYLLIANCEFYPRSQLIDLQTKRAHILQYGTGSTIAIIGFVIWPDLTSTQLLNHAIKTRPTVFLFSYRLFYSRILKTFTYYSFQATHYSFFLPIILNYSSILMAESGQNNLHTLHFDTRIIGSNHY